jgi:hypothetical protein
MARRAEEWEEQKKLARLLDKWLPDDARWTATDPVAPNAISGAIRRARGVKPGVPDVEVLYRGKSIFIELKSRSGRCSPAQCEERERILRARGQWWVCRTARSAMWALRKSGVRFRTIVYEDGTIERWQTPRLPGWEVPRRDPAERRPLHPDVAEQRREAMRAYRERQRDRKTARQTPRSPPSDDHIPPPVGLDGA